MKHLQWFLVLFPLWGWAQNVPKDSSAFFCVDSLEFVIQNAFDDAKTYSKMDRGVYQVLNKLRFKTRPSVIRKLITFHEGDTIRLSQLIDSERLLRRQKYLADAHISHREENGKNILTITTSDVWTTTIPVSLSKPGDQWVYSVGLLESNFLGLGQRVGFAVAKDEDRWSQLVNYSDGHFLFPHNEFLLEAARTTDGYYAYGLLRRQFLRSDRNEWAYTIEGLTRKLDLNVYESAIFVPVQQASFSGERLDTSAYPVYAPGEKPNVVAIFRGMRQDSAAFRVGYSMGRGLRLNTRLGWEIRRMEAGNESSVALPVYFDPDQQNFWYLDRHAAWSYYQPMLMDSRVGLFMTLYRTSFLKLRNYHHIKWTEDVDRGWAIDLKIFKNSHRLGADHDRWFGSLGSRALWTPGESHFLSLSALAECYWEPDEKSPEEIYGRWAFEYQYKPTDQWATVISGRVDTWKKAPAWRRLSLGGLDGLYGFPSNLLVGSARGLGTLEQRWFPRFELGTVVPVFTGFVSAGQVGESLHSMRWRHAQAVAGLGIRLGMSKSVDGVINQLNISWPLNGPLAGDPSPLFSVLALVNL